MRFTSTVRNFDTNLWKYHIPVPTEIAEKFIQGTNKRIVCKINNSLEIQSALMSSEAYYFILLNEERRKKLALEENDNVMVQIEKDHSEFGMEIPEELTEMLIQEPLAKKRWEKLTKGKQRNLIYIVNKVKSIDSRIKKALAIVEHLKEAEDGIDFKRLNELIKYYNNLK